MSLEGFGYTGKTESEEEKSPEESPRTPSPVQRAVGRSMRSHISFARREVGANMGREATRAPLFSVISSRAAPQETAQGAEHREQAKALENQPGAASSTPERPIGAAPPEAWLPNRSLRFNGEYDRTSALEEDKDENDSGEDAPEAIEPPVVEPSEDTPPAEAPAVGAETSPSLLDRAIGVPPSPVSEPPANANETPPPSPLTPPVTTLAAQLPPPPRAELVTAAAGPQPETPASVSPAAAMWHPAWRQNASPNSAGSASNDRVYTENDVSREKHYAEVRGTRRGVVAGLITGYLIKRYLANKQMKRYEAKTEKRFAEQAKETTKLTFEQQRLRHELAAAEQRFKLFTRNQPLSARFEQPLSPLPPNQIPMSATPESQLPVRPGVSLEAVQAQAAAQELIAQAYNAHATQGNEVQAAVEHGEEFYRQRRQEQGGGASHGAATASGATAGGGGSGAYQTLQGGVNPMLNLPSGQVDASHELPAGQPSAISAQHLLSSPPPRNPIAAAAASPLLWIGLAILLLAFFATAFL